MGTDPRAIGILGGTFDPIHDGHLALAREALAELDVEQLLFVPNADPPHKQDQRVTAAVHREAMVALAIAGEPAFALSRIELERPGPSYAVETVAALAAQSLAEGRPEPWFVLSAEVLEGFAELARSRSACWSWYASPSRRDPAPSRSIIAGWPSSSRDGRSASPSCPARSSTSPRP